MRTGKLRDFSSRLLRNCSISITKRMARRTHVCIVKVWLSEFKGGDVDRNGLMWSIKTLVCDLLIKDTVEFCAQHLEEDLSDVLPAARSLQAVVDWKKTPNPSLHEYVSALFPVYISG